jgi:type VI secretion system protein ImpL
MQGIGIAEFKDFDDAVVRMNRLGDANDSPLRALLIAINKQTVWDNPGASSRLSSSATSGLRIWFRRTILRQSDTVSGTGMSTGTSASSSDGEKSPMGPIGKAFEGFAKLMTGNETAPALINSYFDTLGKLRSRLNTIRTQGAPGPGARKLMQDTLSNEGSELNAALALVDDQLMTGLEESQRSTLRPLLLRPLVQTFSILIPATETEVNNVWKVQVYDPFRNTIGRQYPFSLSADVDAAASDVATIFGPTGAVAAFNKDTLGTLVIQRGNVLEPRRWAGMGITLSPVLVSGYGEWVSGQQIGAAAGQQDTTIFQILPSPAIGAVEYTVEIDGQTLRYRNTPPQWETFQWPNASGIPGARVSAVTGDGRTIDLINAPGPNGFNRLMQEASITPSMDGHKLTWTNSGTSVSIDIRIVRSPSTVSGGSNDWRRGLQLPAQVVGNGPAVASPSP